MTVIGVVILLAIIGGAAGGGGNKTNTDTDNSGGSGVTKSEDKPTTARLNETANDGKFQFTGAAHFLTDFYPLFCRQHYGPQDDYQAFKSGMLGKMEKDFTKKLFFDDVKQQVLLRYEALKLIFSQTSHFSLSAVSLLT